MFSLQGHRWVWDFEFLLLVFVCHLLFDFWNLDLLLYSFIYIVRLQL